jgi:hypothetical protein
VPKLPRRYGHFVYAAIQSGVTTAIAAAVSSSDSGGTFLAHWFQSWLISWALVIPIVLLAAPIIHRLTLSLLADETNFQGPQRLGPNS